MVAGQITPGVLLAAVKAAVVIPAEECAVTQWWTETLDDSSLDRDDWLRDDLGAKATYALNATQNRRQGIPDAVDDISLGVGGYRLMHCNPAAGLASEIESQDSLHRFSLTSLG